MIKRPLVWILGAHLTGIFLAWRNCSVTIVILAGLSILLLLWLLKIRSDLFLWFLPLFIALGYYSTSEQMKLPPLYDAFPQKISCDLTGSITMVVEKQWGQALYVKNNVITLSEGRHYSCEQVIVNSFENQTYLVGNKIQVQGTLQKFSKATNPGQFNEQLYYQIENINFKMKAEQIIITDTSFSYYHAVIGKIRSRLIGVYRRLLPEKEAGTMIAMLLGEKNLLDEEIKQLYQKNGISHLLAISGLHISLIGMCIFKLLRKVKAGILPATFATIFFIYSYGVLTNFSVSTNRAVVMMVVSLLATLVGKTYDMLSAASLSAFLILLQNPLQLLSAGFLLSFGAVLGLALFLPCLKVLFPQENAVLDGFLLSFSAQTVTTPFLLLFFYQLPVYGVLTNLLILPFVTVLTLTSLLAGITGALYHPLGIFMIGSSNYILKLYECICRWGSSLPGNLYTTGKPSEIRVILYFLLILTFMWFVTRYQKKTSLFLLLTAYVLLLFPKRYGGLEITVLDVGQGESIFLRNEQGTAFLVDGGSTDISKVGIYRILPFLNSQGVAILDYVLMTHSDYDHISGLFELIESGQIKIGTLILPQIGEKEEAYLKFEALAEKNRIPVQYMAAGESILDGSLSIFCLHPQADFSSKSANAKSLVLSVHYGEFDLLLTGDMEQEQEVPVLKLLKTPDIWKPGVPEPVMDYDVLKVAHHGSKYSTNQEFLNQIRPEISIISCGYQNRYGHPHEELLERLIEIESDIKITYESGAITIKTDGKRMVVEEYLK